VFISSRVRAQRVIREHLCANSWVRCDTLAKRAHVTPKQMGFELVLLLRLGKVEHRKLTLKKTIVPTTVLEWRLIA
jgi:hypothetical protein